MIVKIIKDQAVKVMVNKNNNNKTSINQYKIKIRKIKNNKFKKNKYLILRRSIKQKMYKKCKMMNKNKRQRFKNNY